MTRADRPLHIVGVPQPGHICPSGKCAKRDSAATASVSADESDPLDAPRGHSERSRGGSEPTDHGHVPTQAERDQFWSDQPIHITHPEGTTK